MKTRRQHYVQVALINHWVTNDHVGVARIDNNKAIIKEKHKPPKSVFYEDYMYEVLHGFSSITKHFENDFEINSSAFSFKINEAEKYCKGIEDDGLPVINLLIDSIGNNSKPLILDSKKKIKLCRYISLQFLRTPVTRNTLFHNDKLVINESSTTNDVFKGLISNILFLLHMGTQKLKNTNVKSLFENIVTCLMEMNCLALTLNEISDDQFIISDNPCITVGSDTIDCVIFPITPKISLVFIPLNYCLDIIYYLRASEQFMLFEQWSQIVSGKNKVVYCEKYCDLETIKNNYDKTIKSIDIRQNLWIPKGYDSLL